MNKARLLKNARKNTNNVLKNELYVFSLTHTLSIYPINAIYTFIPKNACSTLRFSIAMANGFIKNIDDIDWIHKNNNTFISSPAYVAMAEYAFVILRCPFKRLSSLFLNKFVDGDMWIQGNNNEKLNSSFREFVYFISQQKREMMHDHWRNQCDFLHLESYDDYFAFEELDKAIKKLNKKGFQIYDTRSALNHDQSKLKIINGSYADVKMSELKKLKINGQIPSIKSMFDHEIYKLVSFVYADDIDLYSEKFGEKQILTL